jgi:ABC-2 type transport system permease protein
VSVPERHSAFLRGWIAFPALLRVGFAEMVAYRAEVVIWILTASVPLLMLAVFDRIADAGPVAGMGRADVAAYFVAVLVVRQLTSAWIVWELNHQIRDGSLSPALLKPVHPLFWFAAATMATIPFRLLVLLPLVGLLVLWQPEMAFAGDPVLWAVPSVLMAWALNFAVQTTFGSLAFWLGQSLGVFNVWFGLYVLFSGYAIPLAALPEWVRAAAEVAPFRAVLSVPVELVTGQVSRADVPALLALQATWLAVGVATAIVVWRRGVRRYEAFGA